MRISDWSSDVCSSDLLAVGHLFINYSYFVNRFIYIDDLTLLDIVSALILIWVVLDCTRRVIGWALPITALLFMGWALFVTQVDPLTLLDQLYMTTEGIFGSSLGVSASFVMVFVIFRSEEHPSELQSLIHISSDVFC